MHSKYLRYFLIILLTMFGFSALAESTLSNLHVSRSPQEWHFVFTMSSPVPYNIFMLDNPERIVVDLKDIRLHHSFSNAQYADTPVKNIRMGPHGENGLRLVLDLAYPVQLKTRALQDPLHDNSGQLILDLKRRGQKVLAFSWPFPANSTKKKSSEELPPPAPVQIESPYHSQNVIVVIDPGHGGKDPGATGERGVKEKMVVLQIANALKKDINRQRGFTAVLTRDQDYYIPLRQRLGIARKYKADMFISIHADAYRNRDARGASVFALSPRGATSEAARWLATRENESELMGGVDLSDKTNVLRSVLLNLSQTATIRASLQLGQDIIQSLGHITLLHHGRVEQAAFVVLKSPDIPSLLIESGYISNLTEERLLNNNAYRNRLADAVTKGVTDYFVHHPKRGI